MVNAIVVCIVVFRSVMDSDMSAKVVLGVNTHDAGVVGKTDNCDGGGCPMGSECPNKATRSCVVDVNNDSNGAYCSTEFSHPTGDLTGHMEHELLALCLL